jgi:hypothetical protein
MDTTKIGWAVQRTGAGREKAGEPVDPHAGIEFHARRGARVEEGQPIATLYATNARLLPEPIELLRQAIVIAGNPTGTSRVSQPHLHPRKCRSPSPRCCKVIESLSFKRFRPSPDTRVQGEILDRFTGILGILAVLLAAWLGSTNRNASAGAPSPGASACKSASPSSCCASTTASAP